MAPSSPYRSDKMDAMPPRFDPETLNVLEPIRRA
jgi:hypothetical protein